MKRKLDPWSQCFGLWFLYCLGNWVACFMYLNLLHTVICSSTVQRTKLNQMHFNINLTNWVNKKQRTYYNQCFKLLFMQMLLRRLFLQFKVPHVIINCTGYLSIDIYGKCSDKLVFSEHVGRYIAIIYWHCY